MANGLTSGELVKLRIFAYDDEERIIPKDMFDVMYNPSSYTVSHKADFKEREAIGQPGTEQKFNRLTSNDLTLEFMLDATGASDPTGALHLAQGIPVLGDLVAGVSVKLLFERFLQVTYLISGDKHRPRYLKLVWGVGFVMDCVMMSADITYTLFNPSGMPVRAKVKAVFRESQSPNFLQKLFKLRSPDLTHIRAVEEGDNLPLMAEKVYDEPKHYIELARVNRLKNFRRLRVGNELNFPPVRSSDS